MKKFVIISLILLTGCTFQTKHRGYVFPSDMESEITGIKTTDQLLDKIGSPQVKTIYGDTVWVYYGADENYRGPLPMTYDNKTVLLAWVKGNRVTKTMILHTYLDEIPLLEKTQCLKDNNVRIIIDNDKEMIRISKLVEKQFPHLVESCRIKKSEIEDENYEDEYDDYDTTNTIFEM